jgi:hypothetical protein
MVVQLGRGGWIEEGRGIVEVAQWYPVGLHGGEARDSQWGWTAVELAESEAQPVMQQTSQKGSNDVTMLQKFEVSQTIN